MIELVNIKKSFGPKTITNELSLTVNEGEFLVIVGRSGEGKSVLLKQIIGLLTPDSGEVFLEGKEISRLQGPSREEVYKKCGYVFQFAALLDSLTVFENIGITLLEKGEHPDKVKPLVLEKLESVGLDSEVLLKFPDELSGGMKKRVGLARTLMLTPKVLIYDEPTTGLDPITVKLIHELMKNTHDKFKTTSIVISHDVEIFKYATHVAMLHEGKIAIKTTAHDIWENKNPYIHQFIRGEIDGPIEMLGFKTQSPIKKES